MVNNLCGKGIKIEERGRNKGGRNKGGTDEVQSEFSSLLFLETLVLAVGKNFV